MTAADRSDWHTRYAAALDEAAARRADSAGSRIACGLTNNVDRVVTLDGTHLSELARGCRLDLDGPTISRIVSPADCLTGLLQCLRAGRGTDLPVTSAETQAWMTRQFIGRFQLGGTGAQAANTLAGLGFDTLLHVTSLSPAQARVLDHSGRLFVPTLVGLRPPVLAVRPDDPTMEHVVFEYPSGCRVELSDRTILAPRADRVITSFDPINATLPLDPFFVQAVGDPVNRVGRLLLSGFSQIEEETSRRERVEETLDAIRQWRFARPALLIHLELGAMPDPTALTTVLEALAPAVDSVGFNLDELRLLLDGWDCSSSDGVEGALAGLLEVQRRLNRPRLSLHTQDYCLTLTQRNPTEERTTLLYAALVAATRARTAAFPTPDDLRQTLDAAEPHAAGLAAERALVACLRLDGGIARLSNEWLVCVPTLAVTDPAATVGLGDSFTGGVLAML